MPDTRKGHNPSGAPDPTRARAENNIQKDEKRVHDLIHVLRYVADAAGFEIAERIVLIDSQSGEDLSVNRTKNELADYAWNPVTGCLKDCRY